MRGAFGDGGRGDRGIAHALDHAVDAVLGLGEDLVGEVDPWVGLADVLPVGPRLEGRVGGCGQAGGGFGELAVGALLAGAIVHDHTPLGAQLGDGHAEVARGSFEQHHARGGCPVPDAPPAGEADGGAAAGELPGVERGEAPEGLLEHLAREALGMGCHEAGHDVADGEGRGRGRDLDAGEGGVGVELVEHDLQRAGVAALTHLHVRREHGDGVVGGDADPLGDELGGTFGQGVLLEAAPVESADSGSERGDADGQTTAHEAAADDEGASGEAHGVLPSGASSASGGAGKEAAAWWMAARMRP